MKKEYKKTYKIKMVEKYKKSNMKISEFCKINEIPVSTFNRWVLENKINSKCVSNFGEIDTKSLNNIEANTNKITEVTEIKLILPNIEIKFKSDCSKKILQPILEAILVD